MTFALIAACDKEMGIGKGGTLPWRLPGELAYFHRVTSGVSGSGKQNAVIMGRKTWESIPEHRRPLPKRLNCVITRQGGYALPEGVLRFGSLEECLAVLTQGDFSSVAIKQTDALPSEKSLGFALHGGGEKGIERVFIIGGGELFRQAIAMPECDTIYLTEVDSVFGCDTFFPPLPSAFEKVQESEVRQENGLHYRFVIYKRTGGAFPISLDQD